MVSFYVKKTNTKKKDGTCLNCGREFTPNTIDTSCPYCGSTNTIYTGEDEELKKAFESKGK